MGEVNNLKQASERIVGFVAPTVKVKCGETVRCEIIGWLDAAPLWPKLKDAVKAGVRLWKNLDASKQFELRAGLAYMPGGFTNPMTGGEVGGLDADQTKVLIEQVATERRTLDEEQNRAIDSLIEQLDIAPDVLMELACKSTGKEQGFFEDGSKCSFSDVLKVARTAFFINFIQNEDLRDFFGDGLSLLGASQPAPDGNGT